MRRMPIRARVTLAFAGATALVLAALGFFIYLRFANQLDTAINQGLGSRANDVVALLAGQNRPGRGNARSPLAGQQSFAQILASGGGIVDSTPQVARHPLLSPAELARAEHHAFFFDRGHVSGIAGPTRIFAKPAAAGRPGLLVAVGVSLDDRIDALHNLRRLLLIGGPIALLLASIVGYAAISAALRPVEAMRRRAAEISAVEPDQRLPVSETDDELSRLGETLNAMLARLQLAVERERRFVDDASHELRTPLAMHKTELELALRYGNDAAKLREAIASAAVEVDRLIQLAEDLLVVARSDQGRLALEPSRNDVGKLLGALGERFSSRAAEAERKLVVSPADGLAVEADRARLDQALTNLVDNALRHGRGEVLIHAAEANGRVELHVEDRGPGFPSEFIDRAFERFARADPARTGGGSGLGLAIVEAVARAHGGRARAQNRPGGGADVWIELPRDG